MTDYLALAERLELANGYDSTPRLLSNCKEASQALREAHAERESFYMDYRMKCDEQTKEAHAEIEKYDEANEHLKKREVWLNDLLFKSEQKVERLRALLREARGFVEGDHWGVNAEVLARIDAELGEKHG